MVKSVLLICIFLFSIAGICDFIYILRLIFYFPNVRINSYAFLVLKKGYAVKQLKYIWQKIKWHGDEFAVGIIAISDDLDDKELLVCKNFIVDKNIILSTTKLLPEFICMHRSL